MAAVKATNAERKAWWAKRMRINERKALENPVAFLEERGLDSSGNAAAKVRAYFASERANAGVDPEPGDS